MGCVGVTASESSSKDKEGRTVGSRGVHKHMVGPGNPVENRFVTACDLLETGAYARRGVLLKMTEALILSNAQLLQKKAQYKFKYALPDTVPCGAGWQVCMLKV